MTIAGNRSSAWWLAWLLAWVMGVTFVPEARAAELPPGGYFWYVPEHEKYALTEFYAQPDFGSAQFQITRTQRFRYVSGQRGWAQLEFDGGMQAYIHLRILRTLLHDPAALDPWYEFERASVFAEEPEKIEARLRPPSRDPQSADSKLPVWKRYKEGWSINRPRVQPDSGTGEPSPDAARSPEKKARSRYSPLPPLTAEPLPEPAP